MINELRELSLLLSAGFALFFGARETTNPARKLPRSAVITIKPDNKVSKRLKLVWRDAGIPSKGKNVK